jgi:hypothetical protein
MKTESQNLQIAKWLRDNGSIHFFEALEEFACSRLSARIHDLKQRGLDILSVPMKLPNGKRVVRYQWVSTERNDKILKAMEATK